jgi:hypothetical protein
MLQRRLLRARSWFLCNDHTHVLVEFDHFGMRLDAIRGESNDVEAFWRGRSRESHVRLARFEHVLQAHFYFGESHTLALSIHTFFRHVYVCMYVVYRRMLLLSCTHAHPCIQSIQSYMGMHTYALATLSYILMHRHARAVQSYTGIHTYARAVQSYMGMHIYARAMQSCMGMHRSAGSNLSYMVVHTSARPVLLHTCYYLPYAHNIKHSIYVCKAKYMCMFSTVYEKYTCHTPSSWNVHKSHIWYLAMLCPSQMCRCIHLLHGAMFFSQEMSVEILRSKVYHAHMVEESTDENRPCVW